MRLGSGGRRKYTCEHYGESFGASLYHYQDYRNREIDAVLELKDGVYVVPVTSLRE